MGLMAFWIHNKSQKIILILDTHILILFVYFCSMPTETKEETFTLEEILTSLKTVHRLILWNDDVNTFEHVIWCMMKYLDYTEAQGEKIAFEVHTKGKCAVLEGSFTEMEVYRKILQQEGLTVSVD